MVGGSNITLTGNIANENTDSGILVGGSNITLSANTANNNHVHGIYLDKTSYSSLSGNIVNNNNEAGIYLDNSSNNNLTGNIISGSGNYGLWLNGSSNDNLIYNNYFNNTNNTHVSSGSTGNTWNITPVNGTSIVGGPEIGGNCWATPSGTGWSQTHPDIGMGFTEPYNITGSSLNGYQVYGPPMTVPVNIDYHPLYLYTPTPVPTPSPTPSGSYSVVIQPVTPGTLPFDASFTGNNIPQNMESCHSYSVGVTVKNTGTMNWSSANGVVLVSTSSNGFTFDPSRCPIPPGVVVQPGQSYTFPVTITVPCPMKDGTYQLRFKMAYTVQTKSGPVEIPFGDSLAESVTVGTSSTTGVKSGMKAITQSSTISGSSTGSVSRQFTTVIPNTEVSSLTPAHGYLAGSRTNTVTTTVFRNFNAITGLLWYSLQLDE